GVQTCALPISSDLFQSRARDCSLVSIRSNISTIPGQGNKPVMDPLVSIIIPARTDAQSLRLTLDYLERLHGIETAEIIVAAAGDTKATEDAVAGRAAI